MNNLKKIFVLTVITTTLSSGGLFKNASALPSNDPTLLTKEEMIQDIVDDQKLSEQEAEKIVTQYIDECNKQKEALKSSNIQIEPDKNDDENNASLAKSVGSYPYRNGVILVTDDGLTGHAGIIWTPSTTIESFPDGGVQRCYNEWDRRYDSVYGVTVHGTTLDEDNEASNWCKAQEGKPYNRNFFNIETRSSFYCSHLVWASFKDLYGRDITDNPRPIVPAYLVNSSSTGLIYQK